MRILPIPIDNQAEIFSLCVNSIKDLNLKARLEAISTHVSDAAQDYLTKGQTYQLYQIPAINLRDEDTVIGLVTKLELKNLYSHHMVGKEKPARLIYDNVMLSAPLRRCPYCGIGITTTLDHYLPKTRFPLLSVLTLNLIPSCKDCNTDKRVGFATTEAMQTLHPYFENASILTEQWLYARLNENTPPSLEYFVSAPLHWNNSLKNRVREHFNSYNLSSRYSVEASSGLAILKNVLDAVWELSGAEGVMQHLQSSASGHARMHLNAWDTAMYQALSTNAWYYEGGFKQF